MVNLVANFKRNNLHESKRTIVQERGEGLSSVELVFPAAGRIGAENLGQIKAVTGGMEDQENDQVSSSGLTSWRNVYRTQKINGRKNSACLSCQNNEQMDYISVALPVRILTDPMFKICT